MNAEQGGGDGRRDGNRLSLSSSSYASLSQAGSFSLDLSLSRAQAVAESAERSSRENRSHRCAIKQGEEKGRDGIDFPTKKKKKKNEKWRKNHLIFPLSLLPVLLLAAVLSIFPSLFSAPLAPRLLFSFSSSRATNMASKGAMGTLFKDIAIAFFSKSNPSNVGTRPLPFPPPPLINLFSLLSNSLKKTNPHTGALFGAAATAAHYNDVDLFAGLRAILQLLLLPRSDGGGGGKSSSRSSSSASISAPSADVERLTRLVERLALDVAARTAGAGVAAGQQATTSTTTLTAAALLVLLCLSRPSFLPPAALRRLRASLASFLPATRAALDAAVASLSGSVESLSCKLAAARAHLSRRADDVDAAVEALARRAAETSRLVEGVAEAVAGVDVNVSALKSDVGSAKEGVALLCRVVADLIRGGGSSGSNDGGGGAGVAGRRSHRPQQSRAAAAALVAELDAFAREASRGLPFGGSRRRRVPGFEAAMEKEFEGGEALSFDFGGRGSSSSGGSNSGSNDEAGVGGVDSCSSSSSSSSSSENNSCGGLFLCRRTMGSAAGLAGDCFK